jgi:hypothetical protein
MKLHWFRNLVEYFPSWETLYMKYDVTHILTTLKNDVKSTEKEKIKIKDTNIFNTVGVCILKKPMVKSVIYLLFSYQTGYIMWHSRLRIYIPFGCASVNIEPKPGMSHYIPSDSWITYNITSIFFKKFLKWSKRMK